MSCDLRALGRPIYPPADQTDDIFVNLLLRYANSGEHLMRTVYHHSINYRTDPYRSEVKVIARSQRPLVQRTVANKPKGKRILHEPIPLDSALEAQDGSI